MQVRDAALDGDNGGLMELTESYALYATNRRSPVRAVPVRMADRLSRPGRAGRPPGSGAR
ncbi:hypothetical protein ACWCSH_46820, partial [Streptosporangium sp. NPDC001682]